MAQPTGGSDVHVDAILTNISIAYIQSEADFISSQVFPIVPVDKRSDKYYVFGKNEWFRDEAQKRGDSEESAGGGYTLSTDSYNCDLWAFHKDIGRIARENADNPLDPDREATEFVTRKMLLRRELQWVSDYFTTGVWGTDITGVNANPGAGQFLQWNDANSDPIQDIDAGKEAILSTTGFEPNTLCLSYSVFRRLRRHPDLRDQIKYTTADNVTADIMAKVFDVERVRVAKAVKATNKEGAAGAYSFAHGKGALLCYAAKTPSLNAPSAGYTFSWRGVSGGLGAPVGVSRFFIDEKKVTRVEGEAAWDNKVVASDLGYFFASAVA